MKSSEHKDSTTWGLTLRLIFLQLSGLLVFATLYFLSNAHASALPVGHGQCYGGSPLQYSSACGSDLIWSGGIFPQLADNNYQSPWFSPWNYQAQQYPYSSFPYSYYGYPTATPAQGLWNGPRFGDPNRPIPVEPNGGIGNTYQNYQSRRF